MIDERTIQRVKDAANVVDVLRDFCELRRDGVNYTCLCPFHEDRHLGSFKISPKYNRYICYACGASGNAVDFLMEHEGLSFPDAIRWLGRKYGIYVEGYEDFHPTPCAPKKPAPMLPMLKLPVEYIRARQHTEADTLCNWIRSLPWDAEQCKRVEPVLKDYLIGRSKQGHTIFWQVDEMGNIRTGKMMRYKPDGHRDKETPYNFDWIHAALLRAGKYDPEKYEKRTTLFGMHLLDPTAPATVNIVESEKTALICAIAYGNMRENVWMASGGLTFLSPERLKPIINRDRRIILYPDHDGIEAWKQRAKEIGYKKLTVAEQFVTDNWTEADGPKADIADIFIRIMDDQQRHAGKAQPVGDVVREMINENPNLQLLIDKFDLYETGR